MRITEINVTPPLGAANRNWVLMQVRTDEGIVGLGEWSASAPCGALERLKARFIGQDPLSGHLFLFVGRSKDRLKILYWDADGFCIWYKRLEEGTFRLPRIGEGVASVELKASELAMMLEGIDLRSVKRSRRLTLDSGK